MAPNCTLLQSLDGFNDYITLLSDETGLSETNLATCRSEVCVAIWGDGNPDISGIGVYIAYIIEVILGAALVLLSVTLGNKQGRRWAAWRHVVRAGLEAYFEFAIYFAISIEIAAIFLLVSKDFGLSTAGFGASDAQIALAISALCILPLLHPLSLLKGHGASEQGDKEAGGRAEDDNRESLRLLLYSLLMVLFLYPFVSQGIHNWAPSRVGEGQGENGETVATEAEWGRVRNLCFESLDPMAEWEQKLLAATEMAASLAIYLFAFWQLVAAQARKMEADDRELMEQRRATAVLCKACRSVAGCYMRSRLVQVFLFLIPPGLAGVLLYGVFRMRVVQEHMLEGMGAQYDGNDWGFGQIVGIIIFAPVLAEMCFAARRAMGCRKDDKRLGQDSRG